MEKIKHFILPENTNSLYKNEASSAIGLTRDVADKINELVDAYNQLSQIDLEWKQTQEGTIRKAVLYVKDNLFNTLHDLVNLLRDSGYFNNTIAQYTEVLESRIDNLLGLVKEGTSSMDAEIIDARVDELGNTFTALGKAIRFQMSKKVNVDGVKEITPKNLSIIDVINPNFFNVRTSSKYAIYGAFSENNYIYKSDNTFLLNYGAGAQFSLEIDTETHGDVFIDIETDKPLYWVRLTSSPESTQGSTLGSETTSIKTSRNIDTNKYLVFYVQPETTISVYVNDGTSGTVYKINEQYLPNSIIRKEWEGKSVVCLGDSITANTNSWIEGLKNYFGMSQIKNDGVGGSTITNIGNGAHFATRVTQEYNNYDCVLIMGGTNDEGQSVTLEEFENAIIELIAKIQTTAPNIKIIFATMLAGRGKNAGENQTTFTKNKLGLSTVDYAKTMKTVCEKYSIPCIDVYGECGINPLNRNLYIDDTVHPNRKGQDAILKVLISGFKRYEMGE